MDKKRKSILLTILGILGVFLFNAPVFKDYLELFVTSYSLYFGVFILWVIYVLVIGIVAMANNKFNKSDSYDE